MLKELRKDDRTLSKEGFTLSLFCVEAKKPTLLVITV
jgi:hypothetical protein